MNRKVLWILAALIAANAGNLLAGEPGETVVEEKIVIALETDDFAIEETDLSHLAVGDAETIVTESGRTVDLLRTEDGIEVYVDGELIEDGEWDVEQLADGAHEVHGTVHIVKDIDVEVLDEVDGMHGDVEREIVIIKKKVGDEI